MNEARRWVLFGALLVSCAPHRPEPTEPRAIPGPSGAATNVPSSSAAADDFAKSAPTGRGLNPEQIRTVVLAKALDFQGCFEAELARSPELKGEVTVAFTVAPDGSVEEARVISSSLGNAAVESCMLDVFRKLEFPSAELKTGAVFPFAFRR